MRGLLDSFWRAGAYCLHPRVIWLSLLPLILTGALAAALGWFLWEPALDAVRDLLQASTLTATALDWLDAVGGSGLHAVIAPLIVLALAVPLLVVVSLLIVALMMMPRLVDLVAQRRFPALERRHGESLWSSLLWSLGATLAALAALVVSMPLWLIPPLVLLLPPLIWGWLGYRVMTFDALAEHATREERRAIMRAHRLPLLGIGVVTGYLGAAPALVWAVSAAFLVLAPLLIVVSVWLYTMVFAFSALWFAHYCLAELEASRARAAAQVPDGAAPSNPGTPAPPVAPPLLPPAA
jgi:hypothetical protein